MRVAYTNIHQPTFEPFLSFYDPIPYFTLICINMKIQTFIDRLGFALRVCLHGHGLHRAVRDTDSLRFSKRNEGI